ncbi:unnamed protein product [Dovyalis caffra]|uniref:At4g15545-like C-terminal domain-containing protein n=1 Tax=Dovyalis caffra TaxID=77055 RepID=A0AAV1RMN2_9ROSI|nr:unnamed protein product [Dovyalis caffra]
MNILKHQLDTRDKEIMRSICVDLEKAFITAADVFPREFTNGTENRSGGGNIVFGAIVGKIKEFNAKRLTKAETLRKADEIFGPDNKDLYAMFKGLITLSSH